MEDDTKQCSNCKRHISSANFMMHEIHCRRHIVLCEHCDEPIPQTELEQHFNELHAKVPCDKCQEKISKDCMEKHMESDCPKKPVLCQYCELTVSKDELATHMEYCGSRTECCHLCKQYVMLKDMLRHESSGCTYPDPKPPPRQVDAGQFSMDDLQQLLNEPDFGALSLWSNLNRDVQYYHPVDTVSKPPVYTPLSNNTNQPTKRTENKKTDVNIQMQKNLTSQLSREDSNSIPPDMDYDTMLAIQLAHDDWEQEDIRVDGVQVPYPSLPPEDDFLPMSHNHFLDDEVRPRKNSLSNNNSTEVQPSNTGVEPFSDDDMSIPCEICNVEVPLSQYLDHVELCEVSVNHFGETSAYDLNNEMTNPSYSRTNIPVINNLRTSQSPVNVAGPDGDIMLPCEFCEDMFPSEVIIQHQSVCQAADLASIRDDPNLAMNQMKHVSKPPLKSKYINSSTKSRPFMDYLGQDGGDADENTNREPNGPRYLKTLESTANKYSPAVNRFDEAMTRPPRRHSRQHSFEDEEHQDLMDMTGAAARTSKSSQRAKATLNSLLQDGINTEPVRGQERKRETRGLKAADKTSIETRPVRANVDSRTVMRQLHEPIQRTSIRQTAVPRHPQRSDENTNQGAPGRSRQRTDNVFSPELRVKPSNAPLKKR
ncbi:TRAF-type zinc finger domain-containing protein 1-like [Physella acuta]|uniref:TRAF-type zinc finger domain-containing protein 1-like n=1 Tax=Physella acuta TaxID=109671 RepID=UPI0027DAEC76|nr:TRAF-type zinc finger domain-containing protein 1-like [Physella acuta]XP_059140017.1 TRAF-type zinc finger domain-containing protein 1-like [Physella acuta]